MITRRCIKNMALLYLPSPRVVCSLLFVVGAAVFAQSQPQAVEPAKAASAEADRNSDAQQRRASLRATLKSLPEGVGKAERLAVSERQLSAQERADLRQQLRQQ
jgi:hypothetical protein